MPAAVTDAYATAEQYRLVVGKTSTAEDTTTIAADLLGCSRYLDRKLDRFFTQDAAVVQRIFYPSSSGTVDPEAENPWRFARGTRTLYVDDIATVTGLLIVIDANRQGTFSGYSNLAATDYQLFPMNAALGPEPKPFTSIVLPTWSTVQGWPPGAMIGVTAKWGWPAVPAAIQRATCQLVGILRLESPRATVQIADGIQAALDASPSAQRIVSELMQAYAKTKLYQ